MIEFGYVIAAVTVLVAGFAIAIGYLWGARNATISVVDEVWESIPAGEGRRIKND